jgi:hypothetical protein
MPAIGPNFVEINALYIMNAFPEYLEVKQKKIGNRVIIIFFVLSGTVYIYIYNLETKRPNHYLCIFQENYSSFAR